MQIVAFPQLGLIADPQSIDLMRLAMREGADVVGGMPHAEASMDDAARHIEIAFQIAEEFNADIDMHVDETDDPNSHTLELLADATIRHGYQGHVTAGHCCALAAYPDDYASIGDRKSRPGSAQRYHQSHGQPLSPGSARPAARPARYHPRQAADGGRRQRGLWLR